MRRCLVSLNFDLFKVINNGSEVDCGLPALKGNDFCLYHYAKEMVEKVEKSSRWEFRVKINEPVS